MSNNCKPRKSSSSVVCHSPAFVFRRVVGERECSLLKNEGLVHRNIYYCTVYIYSFMNRCYHNYNLMNDIFILLMFLPFWSNPCFKVWTFMMLWSWLDIEQLYSNRTLGGCLDENSHCYTLEVSFFSYQTNTCSTSMPYTEEGCILLDFSIHICFHYSSQSSVQWKLSINWGKIFPWRPTCPAGQVTIIFPVTFWEITSNDHPPPKKFFLLPWCLKCHFLNPELDLVIILGAKYRATIKLRCRNWYC